MMYSKDDYPQIEMTGQQLKAARESLGLTQFELGLMLGYEATDNMRQQIARMERGARPVRNYIKRLIDAYQAGYRPSDWPKFDPDDQEHIPGPKDVEEALATCIQDNLGKDDHDFSNKIIRAPMPDKHPIFNIETMPQCVATTADFADFFERQGAWPTGKRLLAEICIQLQSKSMPIKPQFGGDRMHKGALTITPDIDPVLTGQIPADHRPTIEKQIESAVKDYLPADLFKAWIGAPLTNQTRAEILTGLQSLERDRKARQSSKQFWKVLATSLGLNWRLLPVRYG